MATKDVGPSIRGGRDKWMKVPDNYRAKLFTVPYGTKEFKIARTVDGFIDMAVPDDGGGTYNLSIVDAGRMIRALTEAIEDIKQHSVA
jgi:hypothetical protein